MSPQRSWQYGFLQQWQLFFFAGLLMVLFGSIARSRLVVGIGFLVLAVGIFQFGQLIWLASCDYRHRSHKGD
ncbi:MAG: hypothetical protein U0795_19360 [Pirellulales bacterium]